MYDDIKNKYKTAYGKYGKTPDALLCPKGRQIVRFKALTDHIKKDGFTILDFGCGFGDLKSFLDEKYGAYSYTGVDIVSEFIEEGRKHYNSSSLFDLIETCYDVKESYDYILISGVFNTLYAESSIMHWRDVREIIVHLFSKTKKAMSIDFMTDNVDYVQDGSYHQNPGEFYNFAIKKLSRRVAIKCDYMPYEFSAIIHKKDEIMKPANVYIDD